MTEQITPPPRIRRRRKQDGEGNAQFINLTDSMEMDKSSRTKVRVQVMREYHRKQAQKKSDPSPPPLPNPRPQLSAKSQTRKFRLGEEKILRPWVPVKEQGGKRREPKSSQEKRGKALNANRPPQILQQRKLWKEVDEDTEDLPESSFIYGDEGDPSSQPEIYHPDMSFFGHIPQSPSAGSLDPFSTTSLLITSRTQLLLHHYFSDRLYSSWLMMPMRKGMFALAIQDNALFHTFMSHYIARYNVHFEQGDPDESIYHRTQAIRLVNSRLADPKMALTDATIAAVANMAVYESSNGKTSSLLVHLNGLVEMVSMRGGIQQGGFSPNVHRLLVWTDLHCALALSEKPRFPPVNLPFTPSPQPLLHNTDYTPLDQTVPDEMGDPDDLDSVLAEIRKLSRTMQAIKQSPIEVEEDIWYSDKIFYLQRSLYEIMHQPESERGDLDAAGAIVALIYCFHCLRDIPLSFQVAAKGVYRLKQDLEAFQERYLFGQETKLDARLFWILGLGGVAAEGKPERNWFVEEFRKIVNDMGVIDWVWAKSILEGILWHPELDAGGMRLWNEAIRETGSIWEI